MRLPPAEHALEEARLHRVGEAHRPALAEEARDDVLVGLGHVGALHVHGRHALVRGVEHGFRFGQAAYLTDHSDIPEESMSQLTGLDVLFLDALRHKPHPTHSTVERSLQSVEKLAPKRAFFTHICHDLPHQRTEELLPPHVRLAYDGLEISVGGAAA